MWYVVALILVFALGTLYQKKVTKDRIQDLDEDPESGSLQ
jgi:hypothetical protein